MQKMKETQVRSLGQEVPLEEEMASHSSILAWKIPWTEESQGLQPTGVTESDTAEHAHTMLYLLLVFSVETSSPIHCCVP